MTRTTHRYLLLLAALALAACRGGELPGVGCSNNFAHLRLVQIDTDKDKQISAEELKALYARAKSDISEAGRAEVFKTLDSDSNGQIDQSEFDTASNRSTRTIALVFGGCAGKDVSYLF